MIWSFVQVWDINNEIMSMIMTLFILFQLKVSNYSYPMSPESVELKIQKHSTPWEMKWTKIYLPLSLPLR